MILKITATIIIVYAIVNLTIKLKKTSLPLFSFLFWLSLWISIFILLWFSNLVEKFNINLGTGRLIDFFVYIGILLNFFIQSKLFEKQIKQDRLITKLVRELAKNNYVNKKE